MALDRLPPHDSDAEEAVIGSLLIDPDALTIVAPILNPFDFYREKNAWTYEACLSLHDRNEAVNQITVAHELARHNRLDSVGGADYLAQVISVVPTTVHVEYFAQIVQKTALMRRLISAGTEIVRLGYENHPDVDSTLSDAESILFALRQNRVSRDFVHIRQVLDRYFEESGFSPKLEEGQLAHVETGFTDLDRLLGGLQRSDLLILAARPGMGKTSMALNVAHHAAVRQKARVALFSLEMSSEQLVQRLLASEASVDSQRLRLDMLSDHERRRVIEAIGIFSEAPIFIDDSPLVRVTDMRSKIRRLAAEHGVDLIVIDYLQLVQGSSNGENRVQEISEISRTLKALAREINVPVVALSQLSRAVEQRTPKIPILSDLRESGSIEQDADIVMFIYRDDVYYTEQDWEKHFPTKPYPKGIADVIVAKHRNGPTGQVSLLFFEKTTKFTNLEMNRR